MRSQHSEDVAYLRSVDACPEAVRWLEDSGLTLRQAWRRCPRGDWMLWLAAVRRVDRRVLVRAACECARVALPLVPGDEPRPRVAIEAAESWCDGHATIDEVRHAARAARNAAAYAARAARDAAAYAAYAAYVACTARDAAAYRAIDAAYAATTAAYRAIDATTAAVYAACANGRRSEESLRQCATIVRRHIPTLPEADDE